MPRPSSSTSAPQPPPGPPTTSDESTSPRPTSHESPPPDIPTDIAGNIATLTATIAEAAPQRQVRLVAVSKQQPAPRIDAALAAGHRLFGENRIPEAETRWLPRRPLYPDLELRLIGHLQSNKTAAAVALFDAIESVDRDKIAQALSREMTKQNRPLPCMVEVNTGEEPQKSGIPPQDAVAFVNRCRTTHGLRITGLMCIPPAHEEAAMHFALLAQLAREAEVAELSMGMSGDYLEAVKFGATSVRIGSAVFGPRPPINT